MKEAKADATKKTLLALIGKSEDEMNNDCHCQVNRKRSREDNERSHRSSRGPLHILPPASSHSFSRLCLCPASSHSYSRLSYFKDVQVPNEWEVLSSGSREDEERSKGRTKRLAQGHVYSFLVDCHI
jgi:hypothetical protein